MNDTIITIITVLIGSGLIQFLFNRFDDKISKLNKIEKSINYLEVGLTRTQLLVMIVHYPDVRQEEIMKLAYKYFVELKGDFYMTNVFKDYLEKNNIAIPHWFKIGNI